MSDKRPPRHLRWRPLGEFLRANPTASMVRRAPCACPAAEYLRSRSPYGAAPHVYHDRWLAYERDGAYLAPRCHRTSPKVREFVLAVDERRGTITGAEALEIWESIDRRYA